MGPPFNCNAGTYLFCCGSCYYRFCCQFKGHRLEQTSCSNYDTPAWANTGKPSSGHDANTANANVNANTSTLPKPDQTHMIVYVICGVVAIMMLAGIFAKLGLERSRRGAEDTSNTRSRTERLKVPGEAENRVRATPNHPIRSNGISGRMMRTNNEIHVPVTNTVTQIPKSKISITNNHPLTSSSAFQVWETSNSPVKHHATLTGQQQPSMTQPNSRGHAYLTKLQFKTETLPELFYQPLGFGRSPQVPPKYKGLKTNSKTEVTV
ncbi:Protein shisa-9B [Bagarius yarrelli]|uniref:Protein shisa-9B n=1 Tax=Bagarius yarrelli TaxID=175774 RepID=A0A556VVU3_BAGYA|nr:Protein shisa-9B [Bagarius yarrelli]